MLSILLSSAFTLYWVLDNTLNKSATSFLQNEISIISDILKNHTNDYSALDQEVVWEPQSQNYDFLINITTENGQRVKTTPTFNSLFSNTIWPDYQQVNAVLSNMKKITVGHRTYATMLAIIKTNNPNQPLFHVTVAYNITHDEDILGDFTNNLAFITLVGLFLIIIGSFVLIKIGLQPLTLLVKNIENMHLDNLDQRLDEQVASAELKPLVQAFNRLLDKNTEGFKRISDFSSNIAHELRTPINNLMVETEVLLTQSLTEVKIKELLESNLEEYQRFANIIEKLLFLARFDANKLTLNRAEFNAAQEIQILLDFYDAIAEERNISIHVEGDTVAVKADQTLFRNAIANLLENAIKYSEDNSKITIKTTNQFNSIIIEVIDEGPGISTEHFSRLAERFYRVESHRTSSTGGSGLGLTIVDSILKAHGGSLEFQVNSPHGLIAIVHFPH